MLLVIDTDEEDLRDAIEGRLLVALDEINEDDHPITTEEMAARFSDLVVETLVEFDEGQGLHMDDYSAESSE